MRRPCWAGSAFVGALAVVVTGCVAATTPAGTSASRAVPVVPSDGDPRTLTIGGAGVDSWSGWLPDGRTFSPFDTSEEPIKRLDPLLLNAVQDAARTAHEQGVDIVLTSGWRSKGFQERLFADAVRQYGSVETAQQFVASPDVSRHVQGEAVDVAGPGVSEWMIRNGDRFGLCQIYANENWHFELAVDQAGHCPPLRADAAG